MAIGKIDCTVHKSLCSEYKVRGYPTLKFSLDGAVHDYPGNRDEDSIISFAKRMSAPALAHISSMEQAVEFAKTQTEEGVVFVGYDPNGSDFDNYAIVSQVARKKQASAYFLWLEAQEGGSETSFVQRIEPNISPKAYAGELNVDNLISFVQTENVPTVAMLGPSNFHRIGKNGRPLVISVLSDIQDDSKVQASKQTMIDHIQSSTQRDKYYFGLMDGSKWYKFLEQFNVKQEDNPQTIILNVPTKEFWQNATYTALSEFMKAVDDGSLPSQYASRSGSGASGILGGLERVFIDYFPYSLGVLLLLVFGLVFLLVPSEEDLRPRYHPEDILDEGDDDGDAPEQTEGEDNGETKKDR